MGGFLVYLTILHSYLHNKAMKIKNIRLFICIALLHSISVLPALREQFAETGYVEMYDHGHAPEEYANLYQLFDEFIDFLHSNPVCRQKLHLAKERFIRSKDRYLYSTDFFGFYDESAAPKRHQISFYYSVHFHDFLCRNYPEIVRSDAINVFLDACRAMQAPCSTVFAQAATQLQVENIFEPLQEAVPVLFKVVKYLPQYVAVRPHYDGTVFSLLLDSTDNQSLLLSEYKSELMPDDFAPALRSLDDHSMLLIPGTMLTQHDIYPTPHIVAACGSVRHAAIAFAMKPNYVHFMHNFTSLPSFITQK